MLVDSRVERGGGEISAWKKGGGGWGGKSQLGRKGDDVGEVFTVVRFLIRFC